MVRTSQGSVRNTAHSELPGTWWLAAGVVVSEVVLALLGLGTLGLAAAALLAPGFALSGLLPASLRAQPTARVLLAPTLGLAATSLALISIAQLGIPLTGVSVRLVVVALVVAGLAVPRGRAAGEGVGEEGDASAASAGKHGAAHEGADRPAAAAGPRGWRGRFATERVRPVIVDLAVFGAICAVAWVLAWRVIGDLPVPGDDWAKYLLYADEIRKHGSLLLTNELWMGGRPFSEDPGVPSLEGAALLMTGAPAGALVRTILLLSLMQLAVVFGATRAWFGLAPAVVATALLAIVPASQNILGWHGLANAGGLAVLALVLVQVGAWLASDLDRRAEVGLAIALIGVGAAHRFTALFMVGMLACAILAAAAFGPRRPLLGSVVRTVGWMVPIGLLVVLDLRTRASASGGTLPYTSYLATKIDLSLAVRDVSPVLAAVAGVSTLVLIALRQLPRQVWPAAGMVLVCAALGVGWVFHFPLYYSRVTFFVPLPLALLTAAGVAAVVPLLLRARPVAVGATVAVAATLAVVVAGSWRQAEEVRRFYGFASAANLQGLDAVSTQLRPGEIVATDRCWSFLTTWLLQAPTYPALEEQDIQPKAELIVARRAANILRGTAEGRELIRTLPVRYALLDPTCPVSGKPFTPPGTLVFASNRLAIIELDAKAKSPKLGAPRAR